MTVQISIRTLDDLLDSSSATESFKEALRSLEAGVPSELVKCNPGSPPVKVLRLIMRLLESHPEIPLESIAVEGVSGCSDYVGVAVAEPGAMRFEFEWNCLWRAEQQGWVDAFGDPDQIRAAQTFGYQCFRRFEKVS